MNCMMSEQCKSCLAADVDKECRDCEYLPDCRCACECHIPKLEDPAEDRYEAPEEVHRW